MVTAAHDERLRDAQAKPIREVAAALGVAVSRDGRKGYCPEHSRGPGKGTASIAFDRHDGREKFKCHGCGARGDVVDLVRWRRDCGHIEAIDWLLGPLPDPPKGKQKWADLDPAAPPVPYKLRAAACRAFYDSLPEVDAFGLGWLLDERGITAETAQRFGLRYIDEHTADEAIGACFRAGVGAQVLLDLGLATPSKRSDGLYCPRGFAYHLVLPYFAGDDVGHLQFRRLHRNPDNAGKGPKYVHVKGPVPYPWNLGALDAAPGHCGKVYAAEGVLDGLRLQQEGVPTIGVPGTSWLTPHRAERIVARTPHQLVVGFDSDEERERPDGRKYRPGQDAQHRAIGLFQRAGARPDAVEWPDGFVGDWCDWFREHSDDEQVPNIGPPAVQLHVVDEAADDHDDGADVDTDAHDDAVDVATWAELARVGTDRKLDRAAGIDEGPPGLVTGYTELDRILEIEPGDYVLVAGRGGEGKTHFLLSLMERAARKHGVPSGICSLEMSRQQLSKRISDASMMMSKGARLDIDELQRRADKAVGAAALPIVVDFGPPTLSRVVRACRRLVVDHGVRFIAIDYVQYIRDDAIQSTKWWDHVPTVSKALKALFRDELRVPLLLAAQLKHPERPRTKQKGSGRPRVADLSGSIVLGQDAEVILIVDPPHKSNDSNDDHAVRITVAKQNNGATGEVLLSLPRPFGWLQPLSQARLPGT